MKPKAKRSRFLSTIACGITAWRFPALKPTKVTFFCPQTGAALRELHVWTESGRQLLARTFELARDGLQSLEDEIFARTSNWPAPQQNRQRSKSPKNRSVPSAVWGETLGLQSPRMGYSPHRLEGLGRLMSHRWLSCGFPIC